MTSATGKPQSYDCAAAQRQIVAEPMAMPAELAQHLEGCANCQVFRGDALRMEQAIRSALEVMPPPAAQREANKIVSLPVPRRKVVATRWALAASVLLAVALGTVLWVGRATPTLAGELVAHMADESHSWDLQQEVPQSALAFVVRQSGVNVADGPRVTYAHSCFFRGRYVPHLVVQSSIGPVTVMILPGEQVERTQAFAEGGYTGVISPAAGGAFAVLARGDVDVAAAVPEVERAIVWR